MLEFNSVAPGKRKSSLLFVLEARHQHGATGQIKRRALRCGVGVHVVVVLSTAVKVTAQEPPPAMEAAMEELGPPPPEMAKAEDGGEFRDPGEETVLERDRYFAKREDRQWRSASSSET